MSLTAWIQYCKGDHRLADFEQSIPCVGYCGHECKPWTCADFTDGFGLGCPREQCPSPFYTPDPTDPDEREAWKAMMSRIKKPTVTQLTLF